MHAPSASALLSVALTLSLIPLPSSAARDALPGGIDARVGAHRARVADVRTGMLGGTYLSRVTAILKADGGPLPAVPPLPTAPPLTGVPSTLGGPLAGLAAAVRAATRLFDGTAPDLNEVLRAAAAPPVWGGRPAARTMGGGPGIPVPAPRVARPTETRDPAAARAALLIAAALDRYLPALQASTSSRHSGRTVEGCDVLDETPTLCVGSAADNTYAEDEALLIDLGGNDTYRNSAGGSYWTDGTDLGALLVSVNVDLGGDDRYEGGRRLAFSGFPPQTGQLYAIGQGAAWGGVGLLVDTLGDDLYTAAATPADPEHRFSEAIVQGAAVQVVPSFGALMDLGGDDRYLATGSDGTDDVRAYAQGAATGLGDAYAGLVDMGLGDDTHVIDVGAATDSALGDETWPLHVAAGQGLGSIGSAVLYDDGGQDSFTLRAAARWLGPDGYPFNEFGEPLRKIPLSNVGGQGVGALGGAGMLLEGIGDTSYEAEASSEGVAYNNTAVQGIGSVGLGVLEDLAGDDEYSARSSLVYDHDVVVDDTCTVKDKETGETSTCPAADAFVHAYNTENFAQLLYAQGFGFLGGTGMLEDHLGNDRYTSVTEGRLRTTLHDRLTDPQKPPELNVWGYGVQWNIGQGVGQGEGANGLLQDDYGNDFYSARATTDTVASATSLNAAGTPRVTALHPYRDGMWSQGVGYGLGPYGALIDLGGSNDRFEVVSADSVRTEPDTGGSLQMSLGWPLAQGAAFAGNATGSFVAAGQDPRIFSSPARGVCPGSPSPRGYGIWVDCALFGSDPDHQPHDGKAVIPAEGVAPAASGLPASVAFLPETPSTGTLGSRLSGQQGSRISVGARLVGPGGDPLEGKVVHFDLEGLLKAGDLFYDAWYTMWEVHAVTDEDGVARASLPLEDMTLWGVALDNYDFRLLATFDGEPGRPGLYPTHAAAPFTLQS